MLTQKELINELSLLIDQLKLDIDSENYYYAGLCSAVAELLEQQLRAAKRLKKLLEE